MYLDTEAPPAPICIFFGVDTPVLLPPSRLGKCTFRVSKDSSVTHSSNRLLTKNDIYLYFKFSGIP